MSARPVAVATPTLVRDPAEDGLLRRALSALARTGLPVWAADGGSGEDFLAFVETLDRVTLVRPGRPGLVPQMIAALRGAHASGAEFVLYTESDKAVFFESAVDDFLRSAIPLLREAPRPGVVLAARTAESYATFPRLQRHTEGMLNGLCGELCGVSGDYSGPFLMHRALAMRIEQVPDDLGWGWRPYVFATAVRSGGVVAHVSGDFRCPDDQRIDEPREQRHRLRQLAQNVRGLELGLEAMP